MHGPTRNLLTVMLAAVLAFTATSCSASNNEDESAETTDQLQDYLDSEPVFDTEIRWDPASETVTIDQFQMQLPGFFESDGGVLKPWPVLSSLYLEHQDGAQVLGAVGVLRQTFLATDGAAGVLAIPWSFVGLEDTSERFADDRTSGDRRCIVEYRFGEQYLTFADRTIPSAMGVVLLSGPTTPPTVVIFQGTDDQAVRGQLDALVDQACPQ